MDADRQAFEKVFEGYDLSFSYQDNYYLDTGTNDTWTGWQAAKKHYTQAPSPAVDYIEPDEIDAGLKR